jgi:hypothetical protein
MSEETITPETVAEVETKVGEGFWGASPSTLKPAEETKTESDTKTTATTTEDEEILEPTEWLKREFDVDDVAVLKAEREEYKKFKANPVTKEELRFADDESKHIYQLISEGKEKRKEVRQFLETQEQLENFSSIEVNKDNAEDIIKLQMKLRNRNLTPSEIDFEYKQNYVAPREPKQKVSEDADEFEERVAEWKEQVANIETKKVIAAKMAQPELSKLKSDIVLPPIQEKVKQELPKQQTQEELDAVKKDIDNFVHVTSTGLNDFNEIAATVKDKDVEIPISYKFSPEEKALIGEQLKVLAVSGFDANAILADRWVNEDKTFNVSRMIRDLAILNNEDKITQKIANDSASKRLKEYTKDKKNIHLEGDNGKQKGQFDSSKAMEQVEAAMWSR